MPKINSVTVSLDGDGQVYLPGQWVRGQWKIDVGEGFSVRGVRLALRGAAYTRWSDDNPRNSDKIGYEMFTSQWNTVFGTKLGEKSIGNHTYPAGKHVHKFKFQIPKDRIPSSYEGNYGAIRYWLYLEIDRPLLRFNITRMKPITVLEDIDVNAPQYTKSVSRKTEKKVCKAIIVGDEGNVTLFAQTDRGAYCPGEKMAISMLAHNQTERDLGVVKATLLQRVNFLASGDEKVKDTLLQSVTGAALKKGEKRTWSRQVLTVPAVPSTTTDRACQIITVKYFLKVFVDIPKIHGGDAYVMIPVTIGTVPQHHVSRPSGASNTFEIDASSTITHAECTRGFEEFCKGEGKFPETYYIPWCTFVPNFQFPAARPKSTPMQTSKNPSAANKTPSRATKAPLQATTAPLPTAMAPPAVPSAPPVEVMPPSYDDVMKEIADAKIEVQTKTTSETDSEAESDTSISEATPPRPERVTLALLVVLFPDSVLGSFREALEETSEHLRGCRGQALALAPQIFVNSGSWPQRTSIALFVFPTKKDASDWFALADHVFQTKGATIRDACVMNTHELFQNEKNVFTMNLLFAKQATVSPAKIKEYNSKATRIITPMRVGMGGVILCRTKVTAAGRLAGDWPEPQAIATLSQWDSLKQHSKYKSELEKDKFKEVMDLLKDMYEIRTSVLFQSEDLGFLQEAEVEGAADDVEQQQDPDDERREQDRSE